jgi:hypothetical protein
MALEQPAERSLVLPVLIFGTVEIHRLQRELEALEDYLRQLSIREPGKEVRMPRTSRLLEQLSVDNRLDLIDPKNRQKLNDFLIALINGAPVMHISFAADPSSAFMYKLVGWFRQNIHPYALIQLGLQPAIAAGFVLRTTNHEFDFSLAEHFRKQSHLLVEAMEAKGA